MVEMFLHKAGGEGLIDVGETVEKVTYCYLTRTYVDTRIREHFEFLFCSSSFLTIERQDNEMAL